MLCQNGRKWSLVFRRFGGVWDSFGDFCAVQLPWGLKRGRFGITAPELSEPRLAFVFGTVGRQSLPPQESKFPTEDQHVTPTTCCPLTLRDRGMEEGPGTDEWREMRWRR